MRFTGFARFLAIVVAVGAVALGARALLDGDADGLPTGTAPGAGASGTGTPETGPATGAGSPLPACDYGVRPAPEAGYGQWQRTLLDTTFALSETYRPRDLVPVSEAGFAGSEQVRSLVVPDLEALRRAAEAAGTPVDVLVAYRSYARQAALFRERVREVGRTAAIAKTARAGHSEHQLGTTIDFRTKGELDVPRSWESTPAGAWMARNSWRFGFLMSYPRGEEDATCYSYEPWHFRYFGRALAGRIHDSGLTPREYLWRFDEGQSPPGSGPP